MRPFNVEIFDRDFNFIHNYTVENPVYKYDYLTPVENSVVISFNKDVAVGQYIVISNNKRRYEGVISSFNVINDRIMEVRYSPLNSLFNIMCYVNPEYQDGVNRQGTKAIETMIHDNLQRMFVDGKYPYPLEYPADQGSNRVDDLQKIPGLTLTKTSTTNTWQIGLDNTYGDGFASTDYYSLMNNTPYWLGNIYTELIPRALKGCSVGVITSLDIMDKKVNCEIGKINSNTITIEADLPQILAKNVVENDTSNLANKYVENAPSETGDDDYIYYRHSDGSWSRDNTDRLYPVITEFKEAGSDMGTNPEIEVQLFNKYGALNYVNLIELTTIIDTYKLDIGDIANIIVGDKVYESMLTGYEIQNDTIKLIFGMLRLDLTKILKGRKI